MFVHRVKEFVDSLHSIRDQLTECDSNFLDEFQQRFENSIADISQSSTSEQTFLETALNIDELNFIKDVLLRRWTSVVDTVYDYTFNIEGVNRFWIYLAKDLAHELNVPYLTLLIPITADNTEPANLVQLNTIVDPRSIYLSNKGNWYRISRLFEKLEKFDVDLAIYGQDKSPLTLTELFRIRSKQGRNLELNYNGVSYSNFWDYLIIKVAPSLRERGTCPVYLLASLLELIETYFVTEQTHFKLFLNQLRQFSDSLTFFPIKEVNFLYGISVEINDKQVFLVDILLDCIQHAEGQGDKLLALAKWIGQYDLSLVSDIPQLDAVNRELKTTKFFDLKHCKNLLISLNIKPTSVARATLLEILLLIDTKSHIQNEVIPVIIDKIKSIYAERWKVIIDTPNDYFRNNDETNRAWIRLAQYLAGTRLISPNYYKLLIPTLEQDLEPSSGDLQTHYPLSDYILSLNGSELIYLPFSANQSSSFFYNYNSKFPRYLEVKEESRLKVVAPHIYEEFFVKRKVITADPSLSIVTIDALLNLVKGSLHRSGLSEPDISAAELESSERAYKRFTKYYSTISLDEQRKLDEQRIDYNARTLTFKAVMEEVQPITSEKQGCAAQNALYLAKLVSDYSITVDFGEILTLDPVISPMLKNMQQCSARKVFSEYDFIDDQKALKQTLTLLVSLMTTSFNYQTLTGNTINFFDYFNKVTNTGKNIFKSINAALTKDNLKYIRFNYAEIIEHIIRPAAKRPTPRRHSETQSWFENILNNSLFDNDTKICFDPEFLFTTVYNLPEKTDKLQLATDNFLEKLINIILSEESVHFKWVKANIEFVKLINEECSPEEKSIILNVLRDQEKETFVLDSFFEASRKFLVDRVALVGCNYSKQRSWQTFFSPALDTRSSSYYTVLRNLLELKLVENSQPSENNIFSIVNFLRAMDRAVCSLKTAGQASMKDYLGGFKGVFPDNAGISLMTASSN